jgi:hypothetical protein
LGRRDFGFWVGVLTTLMVMVAWGINLVEKQLATYFGSVVTLIGMLTAIGVRRAWFVECCLKFNYPAASNVRLSGVREAGRR